MTCNPFLLLFKQLDVLGVAGLITVSLTIPPSVCQSAESAGDSRSSSESASAGQESFPLWGDLSPGSHRVGFRTLFRLDVSRTWRVTRDYSGAFSPDPDGKPVQLNVWYPVDSPVVGSLMTFSGYLDQTAPEKFSRLNSIMRSRSADNAPRAVASDQLAQLRATPVNAIAGAQPAAESYPLVLCFGGLNADVNSNFVLAEYLASHGYVVASVSLLGATDLQPSQGRNPSDLESVVRDMEFALSMFGEMTNANRMRLAVVGHSVGGIAAAMFGLHNGNVLAVIGLDGTYGFKGSAGLLTDTFGYSPEKMRAAFLDLRRAEGEQEAKLDLAPVKSFRYSDRWLVTLPKMHHSDFTSFAMVGSKFQVPIKPKYLRTGWDRETGRRGYQNVCRIVLGFLDEKLKKDPRGSEVFQQAIKSAKGHSTHLDASFAPPSPHEVAGLTASKSVEDLKALLLKIAGDRPVSTIVDANSFNSYGYYLLGQKQQKEAVSVFEIVAWAHHDSANAQDSLADGYFAIGEKEKAAAAIQRAIELAPMDSTMDDDAKRSLLKVENDRIESLKAQLKAQDSLWESPNACLGEAQPSDAPKIFAPGRLADPGMFLLGRTAFSQDGREFYFSQNNSWDSGEFARIKMVRFADGKWGKPVTLNEHFVTPTLSIDGNVLYMRRANNMQNVWQSRRMGEGWSVPTPFIEKNIGVYDYMPTLSGNAYVGSEPGPADQKYGGSYVFSLLTFANGEVSIKSLGQPLNSKGWNGDLYVAPDESYMIVSANETRNFESELYISFRKPDSTWTAPVSLGPKVNNDLAHRWGQYVTPDKKFLFYCHGTSEKDCAIWWVRFDSLLESLRPKFK